VRELLHLHGHTPQNKSDEKWFERDGGNARLAHDRQLIRSKYPALRYGLNHRKKVVFLQGQIVLKEEVSGIPTSIGTKIIFEDDYPRIEPYALDISNLFKHIADRHFYKDGVCCLWLPPESQWKPEDENSLLDFIDQVAIFFERQLIYDAGGIWAWGERGHGVSGYIEYIQERLGVNVQKLRIFLSLITRKIGLEKKSRCPCGSKRPYQFCHLPAVIELEAFAHLIKEKENTHD
jgi:hypothetical protein